jgi:hypothetical protein
MTEVLERLDNNTILIIEFLCRIIFFPGLLLAFVLIYKIIRGK